MLKQSSINSGFQWIRYIPIKKIYPISVCKSTIDTTPWMLCASSIYIIKFNIKIHVSLVLFLLRIIVYILCRDTWYLAFCMVALAIALVENNSLVIELQWRILYRDIYHQWEGLNWQWTAKLFLGKQLAFWQFRQEYIISATVQFFRISNCSIYFLQLIRRMATHF